MNVDYEVQLTEETMQVLWEFTDNKKGCLAFVDGMHNFAENYKDNAKVYEMIQFLRDIAFMKGQIMQCRDNQRKWIGEL